MFVIIFDVFILVKIIVDLYIKLIIFKKIRFRGRKRMINLFVILFLKLELLGLILSSGVFNWEDDDDDDGCGRICDKGLFNGGD